MKYSASFLSNDRLHPRFRVGSRTANTGIAAQCAAHMYLDALAITAAPNAALESPSANVSPGGLRSTDSVSIRTGSMEPGDAIIVEDVAAATAMADAFVLNGMLVKRPRQARHITFGR